MSATAIPLTSRSEFLELGGRRHHVRLWGDPQAPRLFLLHGWQDSSASFQFLVSALERDWCCLAPDWRGFGKSQWNQGCYWFPDYLADLEALLDHYAAGEAVRLIGHSMGGNVACLYAGVRSARVSHLISLEGFGLPGCDPEDAPGRYAHWLDQLRAPIAQRRYRDQAELASRLQGLNPRLTRARAEFLAEHFSHRIEGDEARPWAVESDPHHKLLAPYPYRLEEAQACWRKVTAQVLWVEGSESAAMQMYQSLGEADYAARTACFGRLKRVTLVGAGHNLHHDQPEQLARLIEEFLA